MQVTLLRHEFYPHWWQSSPKYLISIACSPGPHGARRGDGSRRGPVLRSLDLAVLPRDDSGPPSELQARREKFARFEKDCSEVNPRARSSIEMMMRKEELRNVGQGRQQCAPTLQAACASQS